MNFQIHALDGEPFAPFFQLNDEALQAKNMRRMVVQSKPGTPCRVSMRDADVGETVLLLNHAHHDVPNPYQASHAIFVRENAERVVLHVNEVPEVLRSRLISVRMFDEDDMMMDADVVDGQALSATLQSAFDDEAVAYIHLHNAKPGCFAASVTRATD